MPTGNNYDSKLNKDIHCVQELGAPPNEKKITLRVFVRCRSFWMFWKVEEQAQRLLLDLRHIWQVFFFSQRKKWLDSPLGDCSQIHAKGKIRQIEKTKIRHPTFRGTSIQSLFQDHNLPAGPNSVPVSGVQSPSDP